MEQLSTKKEDDIMRYIIIGNSAAGIGAVEGIRKLDKLGEIIVITDESYHTYSRPMISYLLCGKTTEEKMKYRNNQFYTENNCTLLLNTRVEKINIDEKTLTLDDGSNLAYDKLLVAAGSSAFIPNFEGLDIVDNKYTFITLDDAHKLNSALDESKRVLIVGAGLIGLKCAEGIFKKVSKITILERSSKILSSILLDDGANFVQNHLESKGIEVRLSENIKRFEKNNALLESGDCIPFDILILAVGVRPNTALLNGIAEIDKGIIINKKSETSVSDIYSAGDCTQTLDISDGQSKIMALLPNAYMQGECAGINMAGGEKTFDKAIPMNAIGFLGLHIITAGNYTGDMYSENSDKNYKRLFYNKNKLNGYTLIGNVKKAGIYTNLIREQTSLDTLDFDLICKEPGLMAFTKEDRTAKLGGMM